MLVMMFNMNLIFSFFLLSLNYDDCVKYGWDTNLFK
jgi:hypothetical protein